jgi:hypothetical protein
MKTLLLNPKDWDLYLDSSGNIAVASEPYALAQDVASAVRVFKGEVFYDTSKGIPYFDEILGHSPPVALMRKYWQDAALTVPNVVASKAVIQEFKDRVLKAQIQFTDINSVTNSVQL